LVLQTQSSSIRARATEFYHEHTIVIVWLAIGAIGIGMVAIFANGQHQTNQINQRITVENPCLPKSEKDPSPRNAPACRALAATIYRFFPDVVKKNIKSLSPKQVRTEVRQAIKQAVRDAGRRSIRPGSLKSGTSRGHHRKQSSTESGQRPSRTSPTQPGQRTPTTTVGAPPSSPGSQPAPEPEPAPTQPDRPPSTEPTPKPDPAPTPSPAKPPVQVKVPPVTTPQVTTPVVTVPPEVVTVPSVCTPIVGVNCP
jgi:hypothetical protein